MYMPSIFGENLMDDVVDDFSELDHALDDEFFGKRNPLFGKHANRLMRTDVKETDQDYRLTVDLPGFKKNEVNLLLDNGYLTIRANKKLDKDEKNKLGKLIRQERYAGTMQRSWYVGDEVTEDDIKADFKDGLLNISIAKKQPTKQLEDHKYITIE
ncbi:MAG: Hsp20/alpha crystallin family protein [Oribacterium sp.]|jgi:HSP20 family molecular chaperone IbpA|nr:Hsp20/alpha crystallin family protein [Oribacterium sp.]MDY6317074.1 Hsp20/alpha crystallin family protein [Oribacterium sp.]